MHSFEEVEFDQMNDNTLGFYEALAKGGVGIIAVEAPTLDYPQGCRWHHRYRMDEDRFIPGMKQLVDLIHSHGCPTFMQMEHDGPWQNPLFPNHPPTFEGPPIGASAVNIDSPADFHRDMIRPLTVPEIQDITRKYIDTAERAQKAGFDGVDLNMGSTHITMNFMSPWWNRRDDEYGGTQEKRAKLGVDIVSGIKKRCGDDFPVVVCVNGFESGYLLGDPDDKVFNHELALQTMGMLVDAGADALMIRSSWLGLHVPGFLPDYLFFPEAQVPVEKMPPQYYAKDRGRAAIRTMTEEAKKRFDVPVILIGYVTPELGEQMLEEGKADFIGMNRPLICDTELPHKLAAGHPEDIAPCTRCGTCLDQIGVVPAPLPHQRAGGLRSLRSSQGRHEEEGRRRGRRSLRHGGGSGGGSARTRRHPGGEDETAGRPGAAGGARSRASNWRTCPACSRYLKGQVAKNGVKVELGKEATAASIKAMNPDAVILATGGVLTSPELSGSEKAKRKVVTTPELHKRVKPILSRFGPRFLGWATKYYLPMGKNVVVVGAGLHGMEVAEYLAKRGRTVTIVEPTEVIGEGMIDFRLGLTMDWFAAKGVRIIAGAQNIVVTDKGLAFDDANGIHVELEADTVVPTSPLKANDTLFKALEGQVPELYLIGDGREAGMIVHAVRSGYQTAKAI